MSVEKLSEKSLPTISRRRFVEKIAFLGAATAASVFTTGFAPFDYFGSGNSSKFMRSPDTAKDVSIDELFLENYSVSDKRTALSLMRKQILHYEQYPDISTRISQSAQWKDLIYQCAGRLNLNGNDFIVSFLSALVFVESEGNSRAVNRSSGARGLCQLTWETAKGEYDKISTEERVRLGLFLTKPDDLFNNETNIILAMKILLDLNKTLPDPSLTFWAFHFGQGNIYKAVGFYLTGKEKTDEKEPINSVTKYQLNFIKLISDPLVREGLKLDDRKTDNDDTEFYVPRIMAAKTLLR